MQEHDIEKGDESYCLISSDIDNTVDVSLESDDPAPDPEYIDNYYNDDLDKKPKMMFERRAVITIYSIIGLMFLFKFITS